MDNVSMRIYSKIKLKSRNKINHYFHFILGKLTAPEAIIYGKFSIKSDVCAMSEQ